MVDHDLLNPLTYDRFYRPITQFSALSGSNTKKLIFFSGASSKKVLNSQEIFRYALPMDLCKWKTTTSEGGGAYSALSLHRLRG